MKTTSIGRSAEAAVAEYLMQKGFKILAKNWRTRWCEIDIIAQKDKIVHFIEVKYRGNESQGSGLEHITPQKVNQIKFAVRFWCQDNNWDGDCRILGAEAGGADYETINIIEID